jgi:hypothetical protein
VLTLQQWLLCHLLLVSIPYNNQRNDLKVASVLLVGTRRLMRKLDDSYIPYTEPIYRSRWADQLNCSL